MGSDLQIWIVVIGTFVFVATIIAVVGSHILQRERIRSRLAVDTVAVSNALGGVPSKIIDRIDDRIVGLNPKYRSKLRFELLRAGYFSFDAPKIFVVTRLLLT